MHTRILVTIITVVCLVGGISAYIWAHTVTGETQIFLWRYLPASDEQREVIAAHYLRILPGASLALALDSQNPLCHSAAHALGRTIYKQTNDLPGSLAMCGSSCSSGCFHGILMGLFSTDSDNFGGVLTGTTDTDVLQQIADSVPVLCNMAAVREFVVPWACIHGVGHVVMLLSNYDVPKAVAACSQLSNQTERSVCAGGAFMEFIQNPDNAASVSQKNFYPCDAFPEFAKSCFLYKGRPMVEGWGSTEAAIAACRTLNTVGMRLACIRGVGVIGGNLDSLSKSDGLDSVCGSLSGTEKQACINGAVTYVAFRMNDESSSVCKSMAYEFQSVCVKLFDSYNSLR